MGGWYIFADSTAVGATGSTKTGGMWDFAQFYGPLGEHKYHGEALKEWFDYEAPYTQIDPWYKQSRYFGMTLLGDPTLVPRPSGFTSSPYITEAEKLGNNVKLTWQTLTGADHYVVYRNTDPSFVPSNADSIGTTTDT
jgi:spore germination protein YaaH